MKKYFLSLALFFSANQSSAITAEDLFWIMKQPNLQEALAGQNILKMFQQTQECKATFCFDYIICGIKQDSVNENATAFTLTRLSGSDIFFAKPLNIEVSEFAEKPEVCRSDSE